MTDAKNVESGGSHDAGKAAAMELTKKADMAMYAAKKAGWNSYRFYDSAPWRAGATPVRKF